MSISRRDFVRSASAAAALSAIGSRADALSAGPIIHVPEHAPGIADYRDLAMKALDAAKSAGAEYADVRIAQYRSQSVQTRERRVQGLADTETAGIGVRTLVNGAWGFAATAELTTDSVDRGRAQSGRAGKGESRRAEQADRARALRRGAEGRMEVADQDRSVHDPDRR